MEKIRFAISVIALLFMVVFGLTSSTLRTGKAQELPECNCGVPNAYDGMRCNSNGEVTPGGGLCCERQCYVITE
jgi:hypothetical protein